jgi:hypothetical protein
MKSWLYAAFILPAMLGICRADAIHLKDGTTIAADKVTDKAGEVEYTAGGVQHSVPRSSVTSIDRADPFGLSIGTAKSGWIAPPANSASDRPAGPSTHRVTHSEFAAALPRVPQIRGVDSTALSSQVVNSNGVSERALHEIEDGSSPEKSAAAYFIAARYAYDHSDGEAARKYMKRCVAFEPYQAHQRKVFINQ